MPPPELVTLRERLSELLDPDAPGADDSPAMHWAPSIDLITHDAGVVVFAEVPGVVADALSATLSDDGALILRGRRDRGVEPARWHRLERAMGPFERVLRLDSALDAGRAEARLSAGVLEIRIPTGTRSRGGDSDRRRLSLV